MTAQKTAARETIVRQNFVFLGIFIHLYILVTISPDFLSHSPLVPLIFHCSRIGQVGTVIQTKKLSFNASYL